MGWTTYCQLSIFNFQFNLQPYRKGIIFIVNLKRVPIIIEQFKAAADIFQANAAGFGGHGRNGWLRVLADERQQTVCKTETYVHPRAIFAIAVVLHGVLDKRNEKQRRYLNAVGNAVSINLISEARAAHLLKVEKIAKELYVGQQVDALAAAVGKLVAD